MYNKIVEEFTARPRDVHTVPTTRKAHRWFHVYTKNNILYVEGAHDYTPKSSVKKRPLSRSECDKMLELYQKRKNGEQISAQAQASTHSQVYWYGIFADMNL